MKIIQATPDMLRPYYHDHRELLVSDLKHLAEETYRVCQQHSVPVVIGMEAALYEGGEQVFSMKHFPRERMVKVGLSSRHLLACFALDADPAEVQAACEMLIKKKLL